MHLDGEQVPVPARIFRKLVVRENIGPDFVAREVGQLPHRHLCHADRLGGLYPAVACDDRMVVGYQDGIAKAKSLDARSNLADLLL